VPAGAPEIVGFGGSHASAIEGRKKALSLVFGLSGLLAGAVVAVATGEGEGKVKEEFCIIWKTWSVDRVYRE
jgi:hypothetical protein